MNTSESAEAVVKMTLEGAEVALKVLGEGAKDLAVLIYTLSKDHKKTKGKTKLNNMLKTGDPLNIFTIKESDLKKFSKVAKQYGITYTIIAKKRQKSSDGMIDLIVRAEDAPRVNRIVDRFRLSAFNTASIKSEIQKDKVEKIMKEADKNGTKVEIDEEKLVDDIVKKPKSVETEIVNDIIINPQELEEDDSNPKLSGADKENLSENSLKNKSNLEVGSRTTRKSVKMKLEEIKEKLESNDNNTKEKSSTRNHNINIKTKEKKKRKKKLKERE